MTRRVAACLVLVACGGDGATRDAATDTSGGEDGAAEVVGGALAFRATPRVGETIGLELVSLSTSELQLDVVTRGFRVDDQILSVGFRLRYDPGVLAFASATPGPAWVGDGISMASGATPGVVVAGVAHPYAFYEEPAPPAGDLALVRLTFSVKAVQATPLELVARRSRALVWPSGADPERSLDIGFAGGELVVEPAP